MQPDRSRLQSFTHQLFNASLACVSQHYAEDAVFEMRPGRTVSGHEQIYQALHSCLGVATERSVIEVGEQQVSSLKDQLVIHTTYYFASRKGPTPGCLEPHYALQLLRKNHSGRWQCVFHKLLMGKDCGDWTELLH
jgi:ketosteroid isomerase-like protein